MIKLITVTREGDTENFLIDAKDMEDNSAPTFVVTGHEAAGEAVKKILSGETITLDENTGIAGEVQS